MGANLPSERAPQHGWLGLGFEEHFVQKIPVAFGHSRKEGEQLYPSR